MSLLWLILYCCFLMDLFLQRDNRQNRLQTLEGTAGKNRKNSIKARCRNEDLLKRAFFCRRKLRGIFY